MTAMISLRNHVPTFATIFRAPLLFLSLAVMLSVGGSSTASEPLSVEKALARFRLDDGLRIECVASEPLVVDPVAIRFDQHGRLWVVEMRDYPLGPPDGQPFLSRIRILTDTDGDGRYDKGVTFADQLPFCTGVQPWRDGVIVTLAGQVAFFADRDGDGKADFRETWYRGFAEQNSQLRANHPTLGVDHHVYIANGLRGGTVVDARLADAKPVSISGRDFRFDILTGHYEAISGIGQFGLTFNDAAERFVCSNRNPLRHIVIENRYLAKAPNVPIGAVVHDVAAWGFDSRVYPISKAWTTSNLHAGQFTAACGVLIYRDTTLGGSYRGNAFTCEPTGNLVHREIVREAGATYQSKPATEGREFLATDDTWFRPVNLVSGPDGALYVIDMYRAVIEHPQFMPTELKQRPDLRWGDDRGRIYRITRRDSRPAKPPYGQLQDRAKCAELLNHPTTWVHDTAARLLLEKLKELPSDRLVSFLKSPNQSRPTGRIHALWLLEAAGRLEEATLVVALRDPDPSVRRQAIVVAESRLAEMPAVRNQVIAMADDPDAKVRFQVALSLTGIDKVPAELASKIALASPEDPWTWSAVRLLASPSPLATLRPLLGASLPPVALEPLQKLAEDAGRRAPENELAEKLGTLLQDVPDPIRLPVAMGITQGLARRRLSWSTLAQRTGRKDLQTAWQSIVQAAEAQVRAVLESNQEPTATARAAFALLAYAPESQPRLQEAFDPEQLPAIRQLALRALIRVGDLDCWRQLLDDYASQPPALRRMILDGLLARTDRTQLLVEALEQKQIRFSELDRSRANRLLRHRDAKLRQRVAAIAKQTVTSDRQAVVARYAKVVDQGGDPVRGREVFKRQCATCHQVAGVGVHVGPDISDSRVKTARQFLTDILIPNQAIDNNYVSYSVLTTDGRVLSGILVTETVSSITLKEPEAKVTVLPRSDIEALRSDGISLMPEGLEKNISPQEMADLISFLKNWRYLDGTVPVPTLKSATGSSR